VYKSKKDLVAASPSGKEKKKEKKKDKVKDVKEENAEKDVTSVEGDKINREVRRVLQ